MRLRSAFLFALTSVFALALGAYLYAHEVIASVFSGGNLAAGECVNQNIQAAQQPNPMLFVSCGGFLP